MQASPRLFSNGSSSCGGSPTAVPSVTCLLVAKWTGEGGYPVVHHTVPDLFEDMDPYTEQVLHDTANRLPECLDSFSLDHASTTNAARSAGLDQNNTIRPSIDTARPAADCCYFILQIKQTVSHQVEESPRHATSYHEHAQQYAPNRYRVFGMSCRGTETGSHVVIFISTRPCFGTLDHPLSALAATYSKGANSANDLRTFLFAISRPTTGILCSEPYWQDFDSGIPCMWLIRRLRIEHVLGLVKLLMLEGRILFYAKTACLASHAALALLTLIPGLTAQAFATPHAPDLLAYQWRKYGLPLQICSAMDFEVQPYLIAQRAAEIFQKYSGFVVGTSDPKVVRHPEARLDSLVNLETCAVETQRVMTPRGRGKQGPVPLADFAFEIGAADANFLEQVSRGLGKSEAGTGSHRSAKKRKEQEGRESVEWRGSDGWIRKHFQIHLERLLSDAAVAVHESQIATLSSIPSLLTPRQMALEARLPQYNSAWVAKWLGTRNGQIWQTDYPYTCLRERLEGQELKKLHEAFKQGALSGGWSHAKGIAGERLSPGHDGVAEREEARSRYLAGCDAEGNVYEGEAVRGKREGAGSLRKVDGETYVGEWKNGIREGVGTTNFADGSVYSGEYCADKQHGEGKFCDAEGNVYEGCWREGRREGWGVWRSAGGDVIEGEWEADEPKDGDWRITYSNGDQFSGHCVDGRPHGLGVCKYAKGAVYTGDWKEGRRSGQGLCIFANGEVYDGLWIEDHVAVGEEQNSRAW